MQITPIKILVSNCTTGIYLRWWFNGWHYWNFTNGYEITMKSESLDTQVTRMFSRISKIERPTKLTAEYSYQIVLEGITSGNIKGFEGLLLAEKVEQYESGLWREVDITRGEHLIKDNDEKGYELNFEVTRKELPNTSSVYQKSIKLYVGDTLCDMDDDEVIPINKQVNDIAEMQDRQSDFTAQFKIRKTRLMQSLFELSGETGSNTDFPYKKQPCQLFQNGIEMITGGIIILDKTDSQYYYVSILSGNQNFFKQIELLKLIDLSLPSANHDWTIANQKLSNDTDLDYLYPVCEPSDDGGMSPLKLVGNTIELYGGWVWPFVKVKTILDEIFSNAGFKVEGDILVNETFLSLWMPTVNQSPPNGCTLEFLYSLVWTGRKNFTVPSQFAGGQTLILGTQYWLTTGVYMVPYDGLYKFRVGINQAYSDGLPSPTITIYSGAVLKATLVLQGTWGPGGVFTGDYQATAGEDLEFKTTPFNNCTAYSLAITEITLASTAQSHYGNSVTPHINLPDMSQIDFIKMICNMFALIPDVETRDRKIKFWNYSELYNNIGITRDWSAYLSETDDENEFKFGDYAQNNYLKYKDSDDVIKDNGKGNILIEDETLLIEKDILQLPISTCDEVIIGTTLPMTVSRIAMNKYKDNAIANYEQQDTIDSRIVYMKEMTGRTLKFWDDPLMSVNSVTINDPKSVCSLEIVFSSLVVNYASLSRMLTKTNLHRVKFNLPVYEVAGLKHYIPIYLSQYKAYFYVNLINNFVPGKLCTVDLIKL